jgi:hypothetical protein
MLPIRSGLLVLLIDHLEIAWTLRNNFLHGMTHDEFPILVGR